MSLYTYQHPSLKHVAYFSGIVFLTISGVRSFDAAIKFRIDLALTYGYPTLRLGGNCG